MISLQTRLSASLILVLAVLLALAIALGGYSLRRLAEDFVAARLEHDLETLLSALEFDPHGQPRLLTDQIGISFRQPYSGHYYRIETPGGELASRSLWDAELPLPPLSGARFTRVFITGPQAQRLLLVGRAFRVQGQPVRMAVTEDFTPISAGLQRLLLEFALIALALFGLLLLAQRWLVRHGLAPLERIRRELPRLAQGEISALSLETPAEVRPLVVELNRLLTLLDQRQRRARHALGNLAHALKTPLTALTQLAEQPPPPTELQNWWQDLRQQLRQVRALTERELKRARIAGGGAPGLRVLLAPEIADLVTTLQRIHRERALHIETHLPPGGVFSGDRDDLLELLGNLLDNACQWARTTVRLSAVLEPEILSLRIEDDGPGCPPEHLELLSQRGMRVDESRAGHGLGLAIASDIVAQYGGALNLGRSETLGGFLAEVHLPRSLPATPEPVSSSQN